MGTHTTVAPVTDNDFLYSMLATGGWISRDTIVEWSQAIRGYGLTVHSRAADLRKRGHIIETRTQRNENGRVDFVLQTHRLVGRSQRLADGVGNQSLPCFLPRRVGVGFVERA